MYAVEIKGLQFFYLGYPTPAITVDELFIEKGESVLITGRSGSGKSTLVSCINGIIPHMTSGDLKGEVYVLGKSIKDTPLSKLSTVVGTVLQDPESQVVNYTVEEEVAFGPENLNFPPEQIVERVKESMEIAGISHLWGRETTTLSGGELQRTVLASVLTMRPEVLILDEPTSNIDPEGTNQIFSTLKDLRGQKTLIIVEHKVERVLPFVDRVILVDKGKVSLDLEKDEILEGAETLHSAGVEVPEYFIYAKKFGVKSPDLDTVKKLIVQNNVKLEHPKRRTPENKILTANLRINVKEKQIVDFSLDLWEGELVAIMGKNGAGKTTALKALAGILDTSEYSITGSIKYQGEELINKPVWYRGKYMIYMPQSFDLMLVTNQVRKEIEYSLKKRKVKNYREISEKYMREFGLFEYRDRDPTLLSMGERRRVAMASVLASGVKIMLMDEPTSGQDYSNKMSLGKELRQLTDKGYTVVVVTHDSKFVYDFADRLIVISDGKKVLEGRPEEVFISSSRYGINPPSDFLLRW
ncbi:ABC transporter ATP-binding protein [Sulfolobus acidocaldarius]|uniref:ABC transporter n=4 Tax=Sulfolobus acidocaldarius TaxID=2285 RepID=Q4J7W7_SULAC|nr:ABC transporter ATP-binding protein [Sulfolobus acidocaldarius]AAY81116.1 ABC transporter [Sulfolobus acidocaldarius DSM 639]AGE71724.1 ABC transporter [Sulfolobus acidocaldarius N8]AGE73997.1 ABC transporter [Sulfolobus acidocaldarius Ron12/I]ALU30071.1 cobalt ABC transporter ATP-binding protein [Sulfolobus acidocaldarius]ALU30761.1 cobalt ABC transporter ATP-binding protein [Sulfolobus acidocaldarius]